jgi:hypothetical protein
VIDAGEVAEKHGDDRLVVDASQRRPDLVGSMKVSRSSRSR